MSISGRAIKYVKIEFLNIDGAVMGFARVKFSDRIWREALYDTFGEPGYEIRVPLPVGPKGDERCPYALQVTVE